MEGPVPCPSAEDADDVSSIGSERDSLIMYVFFAILVLIPMVVTVALARHNIRLGRSDRRGATWLSLCILFAYMLQCQSLFKDILGESEPEKGRG